MKGIFAQIEESEVIKTPQTKQEWDSWFDKFMKFWEEDHLNHEKRRRELHKKQKENFEHLLKRSKELGKPVPDVLYAKLVYGDLMVSSSFCEQFKEWLDDDPTSKEPEISTVEQVFQYQMRKFPLVK